MAERADGKEAMAQGSLRRQTWQNWWMIDLMGGTEGSSWTSSLVTGWVGDCALR